MIHRVSPAPIGKSLGVDTLVRKISLQYLQKQHCVLVTACLEEMSVMVLDTEDPDTDPDYMKIILSKCVVDVDLIYICIKILQL